MKLSALMLLVSLALPLTPSTLQERGKEHAQEHDTELGQNMEKLEDQLKLLRKNLRAEGAPATALAALGEIQRITLTCKALAPESAALLPEAERATFVTAYRRTMVDFLMRQLELEAALLEGDASAIPAAFERLRAMEDSAHERFAPEED